MRWPRLRRRAESWAGAAGRCLAAGDRCGQVRPAAAAATPGSRVLAAAETLGQRLEASGEGRGCGRCGGRRLAGSGGSGGPPCPARRPECRSHSGLPGGGGGDVGGERRGALTGPRLPSPRPHFPGAPLSPRGRPPPPRATPLFRLRTLPGGGRRALRGALNPGGGCAGLSPAPGNPDSRFPGGGKGGRAPRLLAPHHVARSLRGRLVRNPRRFPEVQPCPPV